MIKGSWQEIRSFPKEFSAKCWDENHCKLYAIRKQKIVGNTSRLYSGAALQTHCAFCDKSTEFGSDVCLYVMNNFRYRATEYLPVGSHGGHFSKWPLGPVISRGKRHLQNT